MSWAAVGVGIGAYGLLSSSDAASQSEAYTQASIEIAGTEAMYSSQSADIQQTLANLEADRTRKQYSQQALLAGESVTAGTAVSGLAGSSIAANAAATIGQQEASNLQYSYQTQDIGEQITNKLQQAAGASADYWANNSIDTESTSSKVFGSTVVGKIWNSIF